MKAPYTLLLPLMLAGIGGSAFAQSPGANDPTWNSPSVTFGGTPSVYWTDIAASPDGKVLAIGPADGTPTGIYRFTRTGQPDATFGNDGVVSYPIPANFDRWTPTSIEVDALGRLYIVGVYRDEEPFRQRIEGHAVMRLRADGTLDTSYGTAGTTQLPISTQAAGRFQALPLGISDTALQPDGKLLMLSHGLDSRGDFPTLGLLIRLDTNGRMDGTFGSSGVAGAALVPLNSRGRFDAVAVHDDGKILLAGTDNMEADTQGNMLHGYTAFVMRLNASGALDTSFALRGKLTFNIGDSQYSHAAYDVLVLPDGRFVVGGKRCTAGALNCEAMVIRMFGNGARDFNFALAGFAFPNPTTNSETVNELALDANGNLLLAGAVYRARANGAFEQGYEPFLAGLSPDGIVDYVRTDITNPLSINAHAIAAGEGAFMLIGGGGAAPFDTTIRKFVTEPAPRNGSLSSQQEPSFSAFRIGARDMRGLFVDVAPIANTLGIHGYIYPQAADLNRSADVFVVVATPQGWYMRNGAGNFVPWGGQFAELIPAFTNMTLTSATHVPVYAGRLPFTGTYRLYLGYRRTNDTDVIYIDEAVPVEITP